MTKHREPLTYQRTLQKVFHQIGIELCAGICGVTPKSLRNWSDHDCEQEIRMIDAERLDKAFLDSGGDHAPFHRLFTLRLEIAQREAEERCLRQQAAASAKETGEAVAAIIEASGNLGCVDARRRMRKETEEAIDALTSSLAALDAIEKAGMDS